MRFLANLNNTLTLVNPDGSPDHRRIRRDSGATRTTTRSSAAVPATGKTRTITIVRPGQPNEVLEISEAPQIKEERHRQHHRRARRAAGGDRGHRRSTGPARSALPFPRCCGCPRRPSAPILLAFTTARRLPPRASRIANRRRRAKSAVQPVLTPPAPLARPLRPGPVSVFVSRKERRLYRAQRLRAAVRHAREHHQSGARARQSRVHGALGRGNGRPLVGRVAADRDIKTTQVYERVRYRRDETECAAQGAQAARAIPNSSSAPPPATPKRCWTALKCRATL